MNSTRFIIIMLCLVFSFSCKDKSTGPNTGAHVLFSGYSSKCLSDGLTKVASIDSLSYSFVDSLVIDYFIGANCCPDSNRFVLGYGINQDTIAIQIADTAQSVCKCVCFYDTHFAFSNLSSDHYFLRLIHSYRDYLQFGEFTTYYDTASLGEVFRTH